MVITIHQPEHMPWLGFFHKISRTDMVVLLDNVQFSKNYYQNRNRVRTANEWAWITVPVNFTIDTRIQDVTIASDHRWKRKWWNTISQSYGKSTYGPRYLESIREVLEQNWVYLCQFNIALIKIFCGFLGIDVRFQLASEMPVSGKGNDLIVDICRYTEASTYISGISGREYLRLEDFNAHGIVVEFQQFHHPIYKQCYEPFVPCMSVIDLLCNCGDRSRDVIRGVGVQVMKEIFL